MSRKNAMWSTTFPSTLSTSSRTMEAETTWRRLMGKVDVPKLVTALRRLDLAPTTPPLAKRAA